MEKTARNSNFLLTVLFVGIALVGFNLFTQKDNEIASTVLAAKQQGILTYEILSVKGKNTSALSAEEIAKLPETIVN